MALDPSLLALVKNAKNKYSRSGRSVKLKEGKTTLRLVGAPGEKFWVDLGVHWIKTEKKGKPVAVVGCDEAVHDKPCKVCAAINRASKVVSDDASLEIIKDWKGKKSILVNALIRSGSDASEDPQITELTPTTFGKMLATIEEYAAADVNILDLANGVDFVVERIGKDLGTDYNVMVAPKSRPVPHSALTKLHDLNAYIEKEYFRGDEIKALTAIGNMTGVSVDGAALPGSVKPSLLTGPTAVVDDAVIEEEVVTALEAESTTAPGAPPASALKPAPAPAAAAPAPAPAPAPVSPPAATAPEADFNDPLPKDEVDAMLAELDEIA